MTTHHALQQAESMTHNVDYTAMCSATTPGILK